jgi:hypothetical protein
LPHAVEQGARFKDLDIGSTEFGGVPPPSTFAAELLTPFCWP